MEGGGEGRGWEGVVVMDGLARHVLTPASVRRSGERIWPAAPGVQFLKPGAAAAVAVGGWRGGIRIDRRAEGGAQPGADHTQSLPGPGPRWRRAVWRGEARRARLDGAAAVRFRGPRKFSVRLCKYRERKALRGTESGIKYERSN